MTIENSYNFRRISESLTTSGVVGSRRLSALAEAGYTMVINLLPDDSEHALADEQQIVEEQGLAYVHIPVDFRHPSVADFERFCAAMDALNGGKIHLHCAANYRASAFYALYARRRGELSAASADALIRELWDPDNYPGWPEFLQQAGGA